LARSIRREIDWGGFEEERVTEEWEVREDSFRWVIVRRRWTSSAVWPDPSEVAVSPRMFDMEGGRGRKEGGWGGSCRKVRFVLR